MTATKSPFGVAIRVLIRTNCLVQDRFRKQSGFPSSVAFCYSAQEAVSRCGQGSRTHSFYTLTETGLNKLTNPRLEILIRYAWLPRVNGWSYVNHGSENNFESVC